MLEKCRWILIVVTFSSLLGACATPIVRPAGEAMMTSALNDDHIITPDGAKLSLRTWSANDAQPRAILIALHGFNDYSNFFQDTGSYLADQGIVTYAYDQRGFGESPHPGYWAGINTMTGDLEILINLVRTRHPDTPLYLFGESMGGAVVMVTAQQAREQERPLDVKGLILSAPAVWGRITMPWYQRLALWVSSHTIPGVRLTGKGLKIVPSDNIEMLLALGRDPLVIKQTRIDAIYGVTNLMDAALEAAPGLKESALFLYGEKDEIIPREPTDLMLSRLPKTSEKTAR